VKHILIRDVSVYYLNHYQSYDIIFASSPPLPQCFLLAAPLPQLAKCILLHAYSRTTAGSLLRENKQKLHIYRLLTSWHNRTFDYKLRTD